MRCPGQNPDAAIFFCLSPSVCLSLEKLPVIVANPVAGLLEAPDSMARQAHNRRSARETHIHKES